MLIAVSTVDQRSLRINVLCSTDDEPVFSMAGLIKLYGMWFAAASPWSAVAQSSGAAGENPDQEQEEASPPHSQWRQRQAQGGSRRAGLVSQR